MSNSVSFKTRKPIALDQQIKTFGEHKNVPLSQEDALRVVMAGVDEAVIVDDQTGEETPLTMETVAAVCPAPNPFFPDEDIQAIVGVDLIFVDGDHFFLNGVAGRIYAREDGVTVIAAENSAGDLVEYALTEKSIVFGGCKEEVTPKAYVVMESGTIAKIVGGGLGSDTISADVADVDIKVFGGKVNGIYGGGFLACTVDNASIDVVGGDINFVYGGGDASYSGKVVGVKEDPAASLCVVKNVVINMSDVVMVDDAPSVFGGGCDYNYVMNAEVNMKNVEMPGGYLVAGGANGRTDHATLTIDGGKYEVVQTINRGSMLSANLVINSGEFVNVFAGGEEPETTPNDVVNGVIDGINVELNGGKIETLNPGSNGDAAIVADDAKVLVKVNGAEIVNLEDAKVAFGGSLVVA